MNIGKTVEIVKEVLKDFEQYIGDRKNLISKLSISNLKSNIPKIEMIGDLNPDILDAWGVDIKSLETFSKPIRKIEIIPRVPKKISKDIIYTDFDMNFWSVSQYVFTNLPENENFSKLKEIIKKRYVKNIPIIEYLAGNNTEEKISLLLSHFFNNLFIKFISNNISDEIIVNYVDILKNELELRKPEFFLFYELEGLNLQGDRIELESKLEIKKIQKEDFYQIDDFAAIERKNRIRLFRPFMLKIEKSFEDQREIDEFKYWIFSILRLYKLGNIAEVQSFSLKKIVTRPHILKRQRQESREAKYDYIVKKNEIAKFKDFYTTVNKIYLENKENNDFRVILIALEKFNWALTESTRIDRRLTYAVMGLEPLFTFSNEYGISYKLGLRVAQLFSFLGINPSEIRENIKSAYDFRNKVVHGGTYSDDWEKQLEELLPIILEYLRISLVIYILNISNGFDNILKSIDLSLMDGDERKKIEKMISRYKDRFDVCFEDIIKN